MKKVHSVYIFVPQLWQNFAPGRSFAPHSVQNFLVRAVGRSVVIAAPQLIQNFCPALAGALQLGQLMADREAMDITGLDFTMGAMGSLEPSC